MSFRIPRLCASTRTLLVPAQAATLVLGLVWSLVAAASEVATPIPTAYKTDWGPHGVHVIENHVMPAEPGQRTLRARIAWPDGEGPFPLVVYSHGFGCFRESYSGLTDHWASHGYAVVLPEHPDCPTVQERPSPEDLRNLLYIRIADVARVVDALFAPGQEIPGLTGRIDYERKAIAGHSFGGMIAQITWGQPLKDLHSTERVSYALGFDAAIVMSGVGQMEQMADGSFDEIPGPMLVTGGTLDTGNIGGPVIYPWEWRMSAFDLSPPGNKYSVVLEEGDHYLGRPDLQGGPGRTRQQGRRPRHGRPGNLRGRDHGLPGRLAERRSGRRALPGRIRGTRAGHRGPGPVRAKVVTTACARS